MSEKITSPQNPRIKEVLHLEKASERREQQLFIVEGFREVRLAEKSGYSFERLFYCPEVGYRKEINDLVKLLGAKTIVYEVSKQAFEKIAYRENSDGLLAVVRMKHLNLQELQLSGNPLILVLEKVEKPGNLGAILRTADAARVDAILVCDPQTDIFNPNVVRSSIGCLFTNKVVCCTSHEALIWLRKNNIKSFAAALTASEYYHEADLKGSAAILMGTEADGLSDFWLEHADTQVKIPMMGEIDSLNVSTATAVLVFEAMRQRGFKK